MNFEEFNGYSEKANFVASPKLTDLLTHQFAKPFMFNYVLGHVVDIQACPEVTDTVVNIVRGILSFFHVTVKKTESIYELEEASLAKSLLRFYLFGFKF